MTDRLLSWSYCWMQPTLWVALGLVIVVTSLPGPTVIRAQPVAATHLQLHCAPAPAIAGAGPRQLVSYDPRLRGALRMPYRKRPRKETSYLEHERRRALEVLAETKRSVLGGKADLVPPDTTVPIALVEKMRCRAFSDLRRLALTRDYAPAIEDLLRFAAEPDRLDELDPFKLTQEERYYYVARTINTGNFGTAQGLRWQFHAIGLRDQQVLLRQSLPSDVLADLDAAAERAEGAPRLLPQAECSAPPERRFWLSWPNLAPLR